MLTGFGVTLLVLGFTESAIYSLLDAYHKPATFVSVIVCVQGVGAVGGGLSSSRLIKRIGEVAACVAGLVTLAVGIGVMGATHSLIVVLLTAAVFGASLPVLIISFNTLVQRRTPQAIMGRVSTAVEVVTATPQAVSLALGSLLVVLISYREIFLIMAAVTLLAAAHIGFWLHRQILDDVRRPPTEVPEPDMESPVSAALPTLDL
jgi:MFS family permease